MPILELDDLQQLFRSFDTSHVIGLREIALISTMFYTFVRVSAVLSLKVQDYFTQGKRLFIRLHEKGGKKLKLPVHHMLVEYLDDYIEAATSQPDITWGKDTLLFRSTRGKSRKLSDKPLTQSNSWRMIQRSCHDAGIQIHACNHSFRGSGITNYLDNEGKIDDAQEIAAHEDPRTTRLYDRRKERISQGEIERIRVF